MTVSSMRYSTVTIRHHRSPAALLAPSANLDFPIIIMRPPHSGRPNLQSSSGAPCLLLARSACEAATPHTGTILTPACGSIFRPRRQR